MQASAFIRCEQATVRMRPATLDDLRFENKLFQEAKESSDDGLFFKSGLFHLEQYGDAHHYRC